ncbi:MAG: glutamate racemase [Gammaproteobacteria bacterium]
MNPGIPGNLAPIGIFDSGVGGLTVLDALRRILPHENYAYLGDTAHLPYGTKSPSRITEEALHAAHFLDALGIKLLVVACNTVSAVALPVIEQALAPKPVIGVVIPGATGALAQSPRGHIALLATEATIRTGAYPHELRRRRADVICDSQSASALVALAEEGWFEGPPAKAVIARYLAPLFRRKNPIPDCLLLGCTHFPPFRPTLESLVPSGVAIVDSAWTTAEAVKALLTERKLQITVRGEKSLADFYVTDNPERFLSIAPRFVNPSPDSVFLVLDLAEPSGPRRVSVSSVHPAHA